MRRLAAAAALAACALPAAAHAGNVGQLPDVDIPVAVAPPYNSGGERGEERLPGRVDNSELVEVGVDPEGAVRSIAVTQRLAVHGLGDLFFDILAPVARVSGLPGSQEVPGARRYAIVWQGFSPGRKLLAARAVLRPGVVAPLVPLRVKLATGRSSGAYRLDLSVADAARQTIRTYGGDTSATEVARKLDEARAALQRGTKPAPAQVSIRGSF